MHRRSLQDYDEARRLHPADPEILTSLRPKYGRVGEFAKARESYRAVLDKKPESKEIRHSLVTVESYYEGHYGRRRAPGMPTPDPLHY